MPALSSRRRLLARSAALLPIGLIARPAMAADYRFRQFHNQAASSPLHRRLVEMWTAIGAETNGRVAAEVFAENAGLAGSDPAALKMLISGELDFFTSSAASAGACSKVMSEDWVERSGLASLQPRPATTWPPAPICAQLASRLLIEGGRRAPQKEAA